MKKEILHNNEGISPVLGFILMLAVGVSILTTVQLSFVPIWNGQEELSHLKKMQDDFNQLKSNIESGIMSGTPISSPLVMGFKYSPKMLVYNPREEAYASFEIRNSTWVEIRYNEVFQEGTTDDTSIKNVSTGRIEYSLRGAQKYSSFIYEGGLIRRNSSDFTTSSQTLMANNTIFLPSVKAIEYNTLSGVEKKNINIYPTSQQKNSVIGENVWLILHTSPEYVEWWGRTLADQGMDVKKKDNTTGVVIAYTGSSAVIKMGEAYIAASSRASPPHAPPKRIVRISSQQIVLPVDGITNLVVEVQDEYNNPVPNVPVSFQINQTRRPGNSYANATLLQGSAVSGTDGRASVMLQTSGAGFFYIDASLANPVYTTTFIYSASSQGNVLTLDYIPSGADYLVTATLKDSLGGLVSGPIINFDQSDGFVTPQSDTTVSGTATTILNVSNASGIKITDIQATNVDRDSADISWNTINNIVVTAKTGYVFNSIDIPMITDTSGCVFYGTSPGQYSSISCGVYASSHFVQLNNLSWGTAYYFIVNSSRSGVSSVNSTEYMFVTEGTADTVPPASITNLINVTYAPMFIRWTWTDPADIDFDHVDVRIDGISAGTVPKGTQSFNATYLMPNRTHNISIRTVDTSFNQNSTWVTHNSSTPSLFTYVFGYTIGSGLGAVTGWSNAQSASDGGAAALLNETITPVIPERNNYTYVTSYIAANGTILNFANMQSNATGVYASMTEGNTIVPGGKINATANAKNINDDTTDNLNDLLADDTAGGTPSLVVPGDGWYTVDSGFRMYIDGFNTTGIGASISAVTLWVQYSVEPGYGGNRWVRWALQGTGLSNTGIRPSNGDVDVINSYDLFAQGVNTVSEISTLDIDFRNNDGGGSDAVSFDYVWIEVSYNGASTYDLNITTDTTSVPVDTNHYLEINYSRDASDTYNVSIYNGTAWNANRGSLNAAAGTWSVLNVSLTTGEYNGGNPRIRYIDTNPSGTSQGNLYIDYQRIHGYTPAVPVGYHLDIITNTTDVPDANIHILQLMYNVSASGDNFTLQVYNGTSWDTRATLDQTSMTVLNIPLQSGDLQPDAIFTPYTANSLNRYYVLMRYLDESESKQGRLYLDYQRVYSS